MWCPAVASSKVYRILIAQSFPFASLEWWTFGLFNAFKLSFESSSTTAQTRPLTYLKKKKNWIDFVEILFHFFFIILNESNTNFDIFFDLYNTIFCNIVRVYQEKNSLSLVQDVIKKFKTKFSKETKPNALWLSAGKFIRFCKIQNRKGK